jgi:hypothetical protein
VKPFGVASTLFLALLVTGGCTSDVDLENGAAVPVLDSQVLEACPKVSGEWRLPSGAELAAMSVQEVVVCRHTSASTGDPHRDRYTLERAVRVSTAEGSEIVRLLAGGEPLGALRCQFIDSPPPVTDMLQITDETGAVWSVLLPQPDCIGYRLAGSPPLRATSIDGVISAALRSS